MANKAYKKPYNDLKKAVEVYLKSPADPKTLEELRKALNPPVKLV